MSTKANNIISQLTHLYSNAHTQTTSRVTQGSLVWVSHTHKHTHTHTHTPHTHTPHTHTTHTHTTHTHHTHTTHTHTTHTHHTHTPHTHPHTPTHTHTHPHTHTHTPTPTSLFLININPLLSPAPTTEKSLCIPYKLRVGFILTVNLYVTPADPGEIVVYIV